MLDTADLPLPSDIWETLPPVAQALILTQQARIAALEVRVRELEARLGQNSSNSSRPRSSDPPQAPVHRRPAPSG